MVPERTIGASFADVPLSEFGFGADWIVVPKWNLCNAPGTNGGKVNALKAFLDGDDRVLVCTHATFRFAMDRFGAEVFDGRLIAVDEFHHVSANPDNRLGEHVGQLIARDRTHIVAMTGSYFRGDAEPVLMPHDEARFETVTYTYYEQLNGYQYLKRLDIGYFFYTGNYCRRHPTGARSRTRRRSCTSRTSTRARARRTRSGRSSTSSRNWASGQGADAATGFQLVKTPARAGPSGSPTWSTTTRAKRERVAAALRDPERMNDRDHVDIIVALGMAKEGFDWVWCDHALTVGYRSSLTEIVQIIGRATRDAPGKTSGAVHEPDRRTGRLGRGGHRGGERHPQGHRGEPADGAGAGTRGSTSRRSGRRAVPIEGADYGEEGYDPEKCNVGFDHDTGQFHIEIKGLAAPRGKEAERICREDLNEVIAAFAQDKTSRSSAGSSTRSSCPRS